MVVRTVASRSQSLLRSSGAFDVTVIASRSTATATTSTSDHGQNLKPFMEIPGPRAFPLIGSVFSFRAPGVGNDPRENLTILSHLWKKYGDIMRFMIPGREPVVFLFDPDLAEKVASSTPIHKSYAKPTFFCRFIEQLDPNQ